MIGPWFRSSKHVSFLLLIHLAVTRVGSADGIGSEGAELSASLQRISCDTIVYDGSSTSSPTAHNSSESGCHVNGGNNTINAIKRQDRSDDDETTTSAPKTEKNPTTKNESGKTSPPVQPTAKGKKPLAAKPSIPSRKPTTTEKPDSADLMDAFVHSPEERDNVPNQRTIYQGCGIRKGCFEDVHGCSKSQSCSFLVTVQSDNDYGPDWYRFEMMTTVPKGYGYVAMGFSHDVFMGEDSVVECVLDKAGEFGVYMSWNGKYNNVRMAGSPCVDELSGPLAKCNITRDDDKLLCNFYRHVSTRLRNRSFDILIDNYYMVASTGSTATVATRTNNTQLPSTKPASSDPGKLRRKRRSHHPGLAQNQLKQQIRGGPDTLVRFKREGDKPDQATKDATPSPASGPQNRPNEVDEAIMDDAWGSLGKHDRAFAEDYGILRNAESDPYSLEELVFVKTHGIVMLIGWIFFVPNAHFILRYFKESYVATTVLDYAYFLVAHAVGIAIAGVLFLIALISSLWFSIKIRSSIAYDGKEVSHIAVGGVILVIFVIEIWVGAIVPRENSRNRRIYSLIHFFCGTLCYIAAVCLIGAAQLLPTSRLPCLTYVYVILWIVWSVACHVVISVQIHWRDKEALARQRALIPMPMPVYSDQNMPGQYYRLVIFAFHAAGAGIFCTIIILTYLASRSNC